MKMKFGRGLYQTALGLAFSLLPIGAMALDFTPDASRVVSDPTYLPLGAQVFGSTEYSYGETNLITNNHLGALQGSTNTATTSINQVLEYGITGDLVLRFNGFFQLVGATNLSPSGASTLTTSDGLSNPTFAAIWRFLDEKDHPFNWDLTGSYTPSLINAESASQDQNGTVVRGGTTSLVGTALSFKTRGFTVYGEFTAAYFGIRNILNPTTGNPTNYESSWQYGLDLTTQTRFTDQLSLNAGVSQTFNDPASASFVNGSGKLIDFTNLPGDLITLVTALNYQVVPGRFVASLVYSHVFYGNGGNNFPSFPNSDTTTTDKNEDLYGAEVRYVFN
ncbi:MAG TPA: hypothetical protein VK859_12325 [bacterium]|jgi:hypothetical protein|nr:hypothetical protein [bacterium]